MNEFNIVGDKLVRYTGSAANVTVPNGVRVICAHAFADNVSHLTRLTLPSSVRTIEYRALYNCFMLRSINFAVGLETIEDEVFFGCKQLTEMSLPKGLKKIGANAFGSCPALCEVTVPNSVVSIGDDAFAFCMSVHVHMPSRFASRGWKIMSGFGSADYY